jgi:hypothetical protein
MFLGELTPWELESIDRDMLWLQESTGRESLLSELAWPEEL